MRKVAHHILISQMIPARGHPRQKAQVINVQIVTQTKHIFSLSGAVSPCENEYTGYTCTTDISCSILDMGNT